MYVRVKHVKVSAVKNKYYIKNTANAGVGQIKTNLMQHCAGFISAESLYMFRAQAPIIRSI